MSELIEGYQRVMSPAHDRVLICVVVEGCCAGFRFFLGQILFDSYERLASEASILIENFAKRRF